MINNELAIVFPGQGSQKIGMLKELAINFPKVQEAFAESSEALSMDLWDLVQNGPEDRLNQTEFAQPALLAAGVAVWRIWRNQNKSVPLFLAGHSLGEYTALVCAGAIEFCDAIKLVYERGRFMQESFSGKSAMLAIAGLDNETVIKICDEAKQTEILAPANYNSIGQVVLSGQLDAINRAALLAKDVGAKLVKVLPVSVASHCLLMKPAAEKLAERLEQLAINTPTISVINNVDVKCYSKPNEIREALTRQLYSPVRWVETIQFVVSSGVKCILECGPGKVLTGLNKRINSEIIVDYLGEVDKIAKYVS